MHLTENFVRFLDRLLSRTRFLVASVVLLGLLLVGTSISSWQSRQQELAVTQAHGRATEFLNAANGVEIATLQMIRGERGYLLTGELEYLQPYDEGRRDLISDMSRLSSLIASEHGSAVGVSELKRHTSSYIEVLDHVVALARKGQRNAALEVLDSDRERAAILDIRSHLLELTSTEQRDLDALRTQWSDRLAMQRVFFYIVSVVGFLLVVLASLSMVVLRRVAERERAYLAELRRLAETDELTGLANRRELISALKRSLADAERTNRDLGFALIDIDHFKRVNDTYGHPAGDRVIRAVAEAAMTCVRAGDLVGRIGGEEFAIVLPGAGVAQSYAVCERVREKIDSLLIRLEDGTKITITVSVGLARRFDGDSVETIIERADAALYRAKHGGRDQVRLAA
ncbi:MAG: diguanylate cyclase [Novosphingobium sp.]|nr:diguanylate cyclase [Novosphingobium sp.]